MIIKKYQGKTEEEATNLAKKELGWEPKVSLDEGLDEVITYFREVLSR